MRLAGTAAGNAFAERIFIRPKMAGHRFVDHDHIVPVRCVRGSKDTALPELYPDRFKVTRTYGFGIDQRLLSRRRRGPAFDHDRMAAAKRPNRETRGNRRALYSRQHSQAFLQSSEEGKLLIGPLVFRPGQAQPAGQQPVHAPAGIAVSEALQTALERLGGALSTEEMRRLNYEVDGRKRAVADVVRTWRQGKG